MFPTDDSEAQVFAGIDIDEGKVLYKISLWKGLNNRMVRRPYWYRSRLLQQYMHRVRYMYGVGRRMSSYQV